MIVFYGVFYRPPSSMMDGEGFFAWYLNRYARLSAFVLNVAGYDVRVYGSIINSQEFAVRVVRGCDAMEAKAMFVAAILAFPAPWRRKALGIAVGLPALVVANTLRIAALYAIGVHAPGWFDVSHLDVGQAIFIIVTVALWLVWLSWAVARSGVRQAPRSGPHAAAA
jgi:exosortase H (IPTLxxWG-CTERM-specific)